jgi:ABC-type cobalamin/Fe3+-siderophores transport system ATPase subunit
VGVVLTERHSSARARLNLVELGRYPHVDWLGRLGPRDHDVVDWQSPLCRDHLAAHSSSFRMMASAMITRSGTGAFAASA